MNREQVKQLKEVKVDLESLSAKKTNSTELNQKLYELSEKIQNVIADEENLTIANELDNQAKGLTDMAYEWVAMKSDVITVNDMTERAEGLREKSRNLKGFVPWSLR